MAAVAPAADQATDLLQKLSLDSQTKKEDAMEATKKPSTIPYGSVNGGEAQNIPILAERSFSPLLPDLVDPSLFYGYASAPYYYGFDASVNDGVEMPPQGLYGDMYSHGYGYAAYGAYPSPGSPVPTVTHDGQLYGPQHYQYATPYFQPPTNASHASNQAPTSQGELSSSVATDQRLVPLDATKTSSNGMANGNANGNSGSMALKQTHQNATVTPNGSFGRGPMQSGISPTGYQDVRYGFSGIRPPMTWFEGLMYPNGQHRPNTSSVSSAVSYSNNTSARNQNQRPSTQLMSMHTQRPASGMGPASTPAFMNRMYQNNRFYSQYGNTFKGGLGFGSSAYNSRTDGRWGLVVDSKYKPRGRGNTLYGFGNENQDGIGELNRGPRGGNMKNQKSIGPVTIAVKGQTLPSMGKQDSSVPDREQYNRPDFPVAYADAKFFVIKSYSEDDVHKSVKYNVWASTPNGNKKLDAGYREAQEKADGCPVFLFFSVNTSGQFVGVAEMVGPVDFNKTVEYWQQDKWNGCFPLKWYIVKDVPNSILKHITLENNDNKPVTNSRDTQEVKLEQGLEMLRIFKDHVSKTSILDDFGFYEGRQKIMQEKRAKQQQLQNQMWEERTGAVSVEREKDRPVDKSKTQISLESVSILSKETAPGNLGEGKKPEENGGAPVGGEALKSPKLANETTRAVGNGIVNGS